MSKLNIDQKTIKDLLQDKHSDFLIPDYQRPYAWGEDECETLWADIFAFAFPGNNYQNFNPDDEYFLGPIVTFKNEQGKLEVIDGQQRLTTIMLLLRAFYDFFKSAQDSDTKNTKQLIEQCIWKTDLMDNVDRDKLKINSEVATDQDRDEFLEILRTGVASKNMNSRYARNYRLFQDKISEFLHSYPSYIALLPMIILKNCILLPIEAESQDTALRIFSTLNDRGKPLSDSDIFKAQLYKYYGSKGQRAEFIEKWKNLESLCDTIFKSWSGASMNEIFTRYMYYERAKQGIKDTTTESLRSFYERNEYALLKNDQTFENLISLADFWKDIINMNRDRFDEDTLRKLYILKYAPNNIWAHFISVYYMSNKDGEDQLNPASFKEFLDRTCAFILGYSFVNPGLSALRGPIYNEMINIVNGQEVKFANWKFNVASLRNLLQGYEFSNQRNITRSILTWWAFKDSNQALPELGTKFDIEHIYAKNRLAKEGALQDPHNVESIGNKSLLEQRINISASDYRFEDKRAYYRGNDGSDGTKPRRATCINELVELANQQNDFSEADIVERKQHIIESFLSFLQAQDLTQ